MRKKFSIVSNQSEAESERVAGKFIPIVHQVPSRNNGLGCFSFGFVWSEKNEGTHTSFLAFLNRSLIGGVFQLMRKIIFSQNTPIFLGPNKSSIPRTSEKNQPPIHPSPILIGKKLKKKIPIH
jgi:hypothetical protein